MPEGAGGAGWDGLKGAEWRGGFSGGAVENVAEERDGFPGGAGVDVAEEGGVFPGGADADVAVERDARGGTGSAPGEAVFS